MTADEFLQREAGGAHHRAAIIVDLRSGDHAVITRHEIYVDKPMTVDELTMKKKSVLGLPPVSRSSLAIKGRALS